MQRALITGISGFVGGHLAAHLLECGDRVLGASPDGGLLPASHPILAQVPRVACDLAAEEPLAAEARRVVEEFAPTHVYHLAALSVPSDCGTQEPSPAAWQINVEGVRRVARFMAGLPAAPRLLLVSTSHVYAPVEARAPWVDESAPVGPTSAYGRTKLAAEAVLREPPWAEACRPIVVRAFKHTGPGQDVRMMVPQWAAQFAAGADPVVLHSRGSRLDLCDVRDVVRAYRLLMEQGPPGEVYNVGSGLNRASGEIFDMLHRLADPARRAVEMRPGTKQEPIADGTKLRRLCGWEPEIPLEQTLADTLQWWKQRGRVG